jgi:hypothetical protein
LVAILTKSENGNKHTKNLIASDENPIQTLFLTSKLQIQPIEPDLIAIMKSGIQYQIKVIIIGARQVGKSGML